MSILIRELEKNDLQRGFLDVLDALTDVKLSQDDAIQILGRLAPNQHIYVALDGDRVIATTSLLVEQKFIHSGGRVGHIEDVAVAKDVQGRGVGSDLVRFALDQARKMNCYKVILHCKPELRAFYGALGFREANVGMRIDLTSK
ncbi:MAG: GNAT family N-acetyltransferase [Gemmataceae bacterium]